MAGDAHLCIDDSSQGASSVLQYDAIWAKSCCAHDRSWNWRASPLTKRIPTSGRIMVTKGGVSLGGADSSAGNTLNMSAWEEASEPGPCLCIYADIMYIC